MKTIFKIGLFLFLSILISSVSAGNIPENLQVLESGDSSITLDWDDADGVIGYYIYYGTQSGSGTSYETEGIDLIDESQFILTDLLANTNYYIALTSVDEFGTESDYSNEIEHLTSQQGTETKAVNFKISDVNVIDETSLELLFSVDLQTGDGVSREFIIEDEASGVEIPVDISDVLDGELKKVIVVLAEPLTLNTEYKVTVLDISDASGKTIESGINAFISFTTPKSFTPELESASPEVTPPVVEEEEVMEETPIEETPIIEEPAPEQPADDSRAIGNNAGTTISTAENTLNAAGVNEKLPQTGPEHWMLAFIALLLAGAMYYFSFRKQS